MGTSNWQQIPFCIDALMKMEPSRVLDIGVGFGRWGMITREFCDVWYSRIFKDQWSVHLEGIEAFPRSITEYHHQFYNTIHVGDAAEILPGLPGPWSVVIFGDVLEHFTKETAGELLTLSLNRADYVLVNIPIGEEHPQGEAYGNVYERHLSSWEIEDFRAFGLVRHAMFRDYIGRPYGSFVLSLRDPKKLGESLFSRGAEYPGEGEAALIRERMQTVQRRVSDQAFELAYIKRSGSYRLARSLREGPAAGLLRAVKGDAGHPLRLRVPGEKGATGKGTECWVLSLRSNAGEPGVPWDFTRLSGEWQRPASDVASHGQAMVTQRGELTARTGAQPEIVFMTHPFSGIVEISFRGRTRLVDLSSAEGATLTLRPGQPDWGLSSSRKPAPRVPVAVEVKPLPPQSSEYDRRFASRCREESVTTIAVYCPRWLGVSTSTRTLFPHCYAAPNTPDIDPLSVPEAEVERMARAIVSTGASHVVFSGGDECHLRVAERVRSLNPSIVMDLLWHGSYFQIAEDYVWHIQKLWMRAAQAGLIRSICTVKAGMDEFFRAQGIASSVLLNYVPGEICSPPELPARPIELGMWISGASVRKNAHTMLCAASMLDCRVHASGLDARGVDLAQTLGVTLAHAADRPIPRERMLEAMRSTHVSLYVTYSECCPMLPLESLQQGVPCLVGPTSHLFEDHEYLLNRLVVPSPDRAEIIAAFAQRAVEERHQIIEAWRGYAPAYEARARASVARFLTEGPAAPTGPVLTRETGDLPAVVG